MLLLNSTKVLKQMFEFFNQHSYQIRNYLVVFESLKLLVVKENT